VRPGRLIRAARELARILGEGSAVAGGLAVAAWGEVRATRDVDFVTALPLVDVQHALDERGIPFETRKGDPGSRDLPWVVSGELEGARFQVFAPRGGRTFSTVAVLPAGVEGAPIPVVDLPDLIRLKLEAGGPKDLWDVARLMHSHPAERGRTAELARTLKLEIELERWLRQT
jgi:hypothetical protein